MNAPESDNHRQRKTNEYTHKLDEALIQLFCNPAVGGCHAYCNLIVARLVGGYSLHASRREDGSGILRDVGT